MKKALSLILAALMVFSLAACGGNDAVSAKDLYIEAHKNSKSYDVALDVDFAMSAEGESLAFTLQIDGSADKNQNMKFSYLLGEPSTGMNYTGELYILPRSFEFYAQFMGMWLALDKEDVTLLLGDSFDLTEYEKIFNESQDIAATIESTGLEFSDVTEKDGVYTFDITCGEKTIEYYKNSMMQSAGELTEEEKQLMEESFSQMGLEDIFKNLKITIGIDKKTTTFKSMSCDMTKAVSDVIDKAMDAVAAEDETIEAGTVKVDKIAFEMTMSNVGNVADITVPDTVKQGALGIMDLLQLMMYSQM